MKLTPTQDKLLKRFPKDKWMSAYELRTSMATLNALVKKGYLEERGYGKPGALFFPHNIIEYRLKDCGSTAMEAG